MSNLHRGHSIIWPSGFKGIDLKKLANQKQELPVVCGGLCLVMDHNKMCTLYRGPSIDASYQVSVHLAERFPRRRLKCEKSTDDGLQELTLPLARWAKKYQLKKLV